MSLTASTIPNTVKLMQEQKLQDLLAHLNTHSPFYKELFGKHAVDITAIKKPPAGGFFIWGG